MTQDPEAYYRQLGHLIAAMPDLRVKRPFPAELHQWLGRAVALVELSQNVADFAEIRQAAIHLGTAYQGDRAESIVGVLYRTLARAEMRAPSSVQGAFIPAGAEFSAFAAITGIMAAAKTEVMIVDPYADATVVADYVVLAPEGVEVRLLADEFYVRSDLKPAVTKWKKQYAASKPLEVRLSAPRKLHDRAIFVDGGTGAWTLSQSLKDFARRSPGTILRVDREIADLKVPAYEELWQHAAAL